MTDSKDSPDNPADIILQFINQLSQYNTNTLAPQELLVLLKLIHSKNLFSETIKSLLTQDNKLTEDQKHWFCTQCLTLSPDDVSLLSYLIKLTSFIWLESRMKANSPLNFELLKIAMANHDYHKQINENEESQNRFMDALAYSKFNPRQILELIGLAQDKQVKSLLIIYLLTQKEYLENLKGLSFIETIKDKENHAPSRLNSLIHQIQPNTLTTSRIGLLEPEAATSLLFSIYHFHQLSEMQFKALLARNPQHQILSYWLAHYSDMPNAHYVLAHFMKLVSLQAAPALNALDQNTRDLFINSMLLNIELFQPGHLLKLQFNHEGILTFAIQLFLNGHQSQSMVDTISLLTSNLLNGQEQPSKKLMQLLICLNQYEQFKELTKGISTFVNYFLRSQAENGDISLFYDNHSLNPLSMSQKIQLEPPADKTKQKETSGGMLSFLFSTPEEPKEKTTDVIPQNIAEHALIAELRKRKKSISALDYFVMHFKGDLAHLDKAINDYFSYCVQEGATDVRRRSIHHMAILINRNELSKPTRETIFNAFLNAPELYDEQICNALFMFDAKKAIQHFGQKGGVENYNHVLNLCEYALNKLTPKRHEALITIAEKAQKEAKLEIQFSEQTGFFERLFRRFKRCWHYGWTGFFSPNSPEYVATADTPAKIDAPKPVIAALNLNHTLNIAALITEIRSNCSKENLDQLIHAYRELSLKSRNKVVETTRQDLHQLYKFLVENSKNNQEVAAWLDSHQGMFEINCLRLMEMKLKQNLFAEFNQLAQDFPEASTYVDKLKKEFNSPLPEHTPVVIINSTTKVEQEGLLDSAANIITGGATTAFGHISNFFSGASKLLTQNPLSQGVYTCGMGPK